MQINRQKATAFFFFFFKARSVLALVPELTLKAIYTEFHIEANSGLNNFCLY